MAAGTTPVDAALGRARRVHCSALDTRRSHLSCWRCTVFEQADAQRCTTQASRKLKSSNVAAGFRAVGSRTSLRDELECSIRHLGWRVIVVVVRDSGSTAPAGWRRPLPKCQGSIRAQAAAVARTRSRVVGAPRQGGSATRQRRCSGFGGCLRFLFLSLAFGQKLGAVWLAAQQGGAPHQTILYTMAEKRPKRKRLLLCYIDRNSYFFTRSIARKMNMRFRFFVRDNAHQRRVAETE